MGCDFNDVFGCVGVGLFEIGDYGFVQDFAGRVEDLGEAGLRGG